MVMSHVRPIKFFSDRVPVGGFFRAVCFTHDFKQDRSISRCNILSILEDTSNVTAANFS